MRAVSSPVKRLALDHGVDVFQPETLKASDALERVRSARPDAIVVAAYGLVLPPAALQIAPLGAVNIHASLLPRWRGAAPIQRALLAGDRETGISIMKMDEGLDTGPVYARQSLPITAADDSGSLRDKLAKLGADLLVDVLSELAEGRARATPQPEAGITYARKIDKAETRLDWTRPAAELERAVRAFRPSPGAATRLDGAALKVWRASVVAGHARPGTMLADAQPLTVACGEGALRIEELQRAGGKRMSAREFARGRVLPLNTRLE